ncbi:beta-ketoacyl-[acyl-carrier-protein] synthase family protein [Mucisphaera sp.]|uniref:beta-ketoacyl-[acyl-carrier-protein] synthase family protein n=1 Tax=Mucisphaera sp. TaxID=2913024 RepID=UPI003D0F232B
MTRKVLITGLGPVSGLGDGIEAHWQAACEGRSAVRTIERFDASAMRCAYGAEASDFKVRNYVPKSYRKATKVMARDIEFAVACADLAAKDAGLKTKGSAPDDEPTYASDRMGAHIGAGLIAADIDELTTAMVSSRKADGSFDMHAWGREGMQQLTPLWLLKYLPNMLACHVTIIHDAHGPSNTITCAQASGLLSAGESLRVLQREDADLCFCGGAESKINPMGMLRQEFAELVADPKDRAADEVVRPFDEGATGVVIGEGGAILTLEAAETFGARGGTGAYAEVVGFAASQTVHPATVNRTPDPRGKGAERAISKALVEAGLTPDDIDLIVPGGSGVPAYDRAEAAAMRAVFGERLIDIPVVAIKAIAGDCFAGGGAIDLAVAAQALRSQKVPAVVNRDKPLAGIGGNRSASETGLRHVLVFGSSVGGQNAAIVLKRYEGPNG